MREKQPLKDEVRVLLILKFYLGKQEAVLYAVIRGVKGLEDLGLRFNDLSNVINELRQNPRYSEVRLWIEVGIGECNSIRSKISDRLKPRVIESLINNCMFLEKLANELVKLITSANS